MSSLDFHVGFVISTLYFGDPKNPLILNLPYVSCLSATLFLAYWIRHFECYNLDLVSVIGDLEHLNPRVNIRGSLWKTTFFKKREKKWDAPHSSRSVHLHFCNEQDSFLKIVFTFLCLQDTLHEDHGKSSVHQCNMIKRRFQENFPGNDAKGRDTSRGINKSFHRHTLREETGCKTGFGMSLGANWRQGLGRRDAESCDRFCISLVLSH